MNFNSLQFVYFYVIVLILFYACPPKFKKYLLLFSSYYFYMCWNKLYVLLIFTSTLSTYSFALLIKKFKTCKKLFLWLGVGLNLLILFYFKYANFFISSINKISICLFAKPSLDVLDILLPVGISFYTFQAMGYLIDVFKCKYTPEKNFINYALFVAFFPQLVAGPIERTNDLLPQLKNVGFTKASYNNFIAGWITMLFGFFVKMAIADRFAILVDYVFKNYTTLSSFFLILAVFAFSIQIYCDFYGYSLIAIGVAQTLGIKLCDNFNRPYLSSCIKDFWRNWHISLSSWLRDYVYIPLGGNRCGNFRKNINLFVTFLLSGLWHGASWHFVIWGGLHGVYQIIEGSKLGKMQKRLPRFLSICLTFCIVSFTWIFFRAETLNVAWDYILKIFQNVFVNVDIITFCRQIAFNRYELFFVVLALPAFLYLNNLQASKKLRIGDALLQEKSSIKVGAIAFYLVICILFFTKYGLDVSVTPFLYFQF